MTEAWTNVSDRDNRVLRSLFGAFMTGVTVVATRTSDGSARAFTANSFTSVSLNPPLVLVCLAKALFSARIFSDSRIFSISILGEGQRHISNSFASRDPVAKVEALAGLVGNEVPHVAGSLATIICEKHNVVDGGDHLVLIGRVREFQASEGEPLGFFRGSYVTIGPSVRELEQVEAQLVVGGIVDSGGKLALYRKGDSDTWEIPVASVPPGERHGTVLNRLFQGLGINAEARLPYSLFRKPTNAAPL